MYQRTVYGILGLLAATIAAGAEAASPDDAYACRNGSRERWIQLQHADTAERLPCKVVYWRDGAAPPDPGQSIWEATNDFGFCIERTRDLVQRLQGGGWICHKTDAAHVEMQTTIPAIAPSTLPPPAATAARAKPSGTVAPQALPPPEATADRSKLGEALARDLQRLAQLTESPGARFEIESTELGDLDGDGEADAAVLLNYQTAQPGGAQFLLAYRFDGNTFRPAAKIYVGGAGGDTLASGIEQIKNRTIQLLLEVRQQGDLECCPSGRRRDSYVLRDGELVVVPPES